MKKRLYYSLFSILFCVFLARPLSAQRSLYPNEFPLGDVMLLDGPFQHARDLNVEVLLKYDVDRLLQPYLKEAGLPEKGKRFVNWAGLDGHVGGHYLSALAMNYAATGNLNCKVQMDYMVAELKRCQEANAVNHKVWGVGYVGGVPNSNNIWPELKNGNFKPYHDAWVPWYNVHKMYAGLRDVWAYAGDETAKTIFIKFCDWAISITAGLSESQMQSMLDMEHGGMNEVLADAYQMTGDPKYLTAAKRFSHKTLLDAMATAIDNLDNKHANTQVPKAIGFARIGELEHDDVFARGGRFFWETVTTRRSLAFGGNSRREFFPSAAASIDFVNEVEGPESCNSYNMLRLTENLFRVRPSANYADYYERTLFNHILSTQHPGHGGYVYFTPARPRHYRVYSNPNEAMWCCVGSGMENHGKYNQFIYTHRNDSLFVNLFIASELNWKEKNIRVRQETSFPYEERTRLVITGVDATYTMMIRVPAWTSEGGFAILINGKPFPVSAHRSSYIGINRHWKKGDVVQVALPMHVVLEPMPNVPQYVGIMYGPLLLGAKTGTEQMAGLVADEGRWGHIASGERLPLNKAPIIVEDNRTSITSQLKPLPGKPLHFAMKGINMMNKQDLELQPFFSIHDSRYMIYWMVLNHSQQRLYIDSLAVAEKQMQALHQRTVDFVAPGEQQPEVDHKLLSSNSNVGNWLDQFWRDTRDEGYFSYQLSTHQEKGLRLGIRYWGNEQGDHSFDIYVNDVKLVTENIGGKWNQIKFMDVEYAIPDSLITRKDNIRVKFQSYRGGTAGAVYYLRLLRK